MSVKEAIAFFDALELDEVKTVIAKEILKEIRARLRFLDTVGLDYLNLSRRGRNSVRRRGTANQTCNADRLRADRGFVCSRRAEYRTSPAG